MKDKLAPTLVAWILYDTTTDKKYIKLNPADGSLAIFDNEEAAITAKKQNYGTDYARCEYYSTPQQPEKFCEDTALSLAERTFSTEVDEQLAEDIIQYARRLHSLYAVPQPAPNKLSTYREQVTEVEAPSHGLPNWSECNLRVGNSEWMKDNDREPEDDSLTANPLHEFIYEYDDSDAYKSAWFLHRLEKLIDFIRSEQQPAPDVSALVEALEGLLAIVSDSSGVAGYHLNGDIAQWSEFEEVEMAEEALAIYRQQGEDL